MEENKILNILMVEDDDVDARILSKIASKTTAGELRFHRVKTLEDARASLEAQDFHAILLDLGLPDGNGSDTVLGLQADSPGVPIVVLTGQRDPQAAQDSVEAGAQDYLIKGEVSPDGLYRTLGYAIQRQRMRHDLWVRMDRLQRRSQRFFELSHQDPLTKTLNRRGFQRMAFTELRRARREGHVLMVMLADLQGFKEINERSGLAGGDLALAAAADCLKETLDGAAHIGRVGGDEFMALFKSADMEEARTLVERFQRKLGGLNLKLGDAVLPKLEASIGLAAAPEKEVRLVELIKVCQAAVGTTKAKTPASKKKA